MRYFEWTTSQNIKTGQIPQELPDDLCELTLHEASALIRYRLISSRALVETWLDRINCNPQFNAFISIDAPAALQKADEYDRHLENGGKHLPLGGVPIAVKDNIHVVGFTNTAGTPALAGFFPQTNAPVVASLLEAGAIVIGKTNMHELAFGTSGYNTAFHVPNVTGIRNAFDHSRIAGGSSSGSGSAVGARLIPAALGTDTGGSIRQPSSLNGCVGFRPTVGRYSCEGITPISPTRDTPGPMTRSVQDVILMDSIITGASPAQPPATETIRLGILKEFWDEVSDPVLQITHTALKKIQATGVQVVWVSLPDIFELNGAVSMPIALYECRSALAEYLLTNDTGLDIEDVAAAISSPDVREIFERFVLPGRLEEHGGKPVDLEQAYITAIEQGRPLLIEKIHSLFEEHQLHALVHPTTPDLAIKSEPQATRFEAFARMIRNADPASNAGMPSISLPAGLSINEGLPIGIEFDGLPGSDSQLLAIASVMEDVLGRESSPLQKNTC
ncbi:indole acetimide hydrolase [Pseudomonas silesiensis]|uniref:Indole acetimide hydrolase n=1 Tax=Pseudomonas silesiensis TaxID=1853130 RepID=A0A191Z0K3_9PSED|nr:indoleacetamide hydrolase [Pseudomonas silesiensis]ANJ58471.1 indole acetimide hydrolase [Pseudomonas silesiensis]